ncbi:MAG: 4-(cytidine 5'-diphospho)-2-C-methyl-D-erythritol kinase [Pseudolabrys sp.]
MSATLVEKASAKINLTLRVIGRRADGYHELESLVVFADVADTLTLRTSQDGLEIIGPFAGKTGSSADNLVFKAVAAVRGRIADVKAGHFLLEKNVPVAAGLGGGSADAAAALRLIARTNGLALDDPRLFLAARAVGADVPVCLDPRPRIMRGIGELLSDPLDLPALPAVLVNPGVPLATRDVFGKLRNGQRGSDIADVPHDVDELIEFLEQHGNDLTSAAIACEPVIAEVLAALRGLSGVKLARMSGSGPTCFALFGCRDEAAAASQRLVKEHKNWWVKPTTLGSAPNTNC